VTERKLDKPVVVLDIIEPGITPDYCCHGRATCIACNEWVWLGHKTFEVVNSGEALPICMPCAIRNIPPDTEPIARVEDHLRADGPHE
jgi:hypothetical protein